MSSRSLLDEARIGNALIGILYAIPTTPLYARLEKDGRLNAEEGSRGRARFQRHCARQWRDKDAARFRLPPSVDYGATPLANHVAVPFPSFWIDWLAHGAEQSQR